LNNLGAIARRTTHEETYIIVGDKNIVPLEVAILAAFYFIGTSSCPEP